MSATAAALDHVGIAARDLGPLAAAYQRLGFALFAVAQQSGAAAGRTCRWSPGAPAIAAPSSSTAISS